jgi:hypothetical protein
VALPFDAALGTILYISPAGQARDFRRIVGVGDEVRGARVVDIMPTTVMLRDAPGDGASGLLGPMPADVIVIVKPATH